MLECRVAVVVVAQRDHVSGGGLPVGATHAPLQCLGEGLSGEGGAPSHSQILASSVVAGLEAHECGLGEQVITLHSWYPTWVEWIAAVGQLV